MPGQVSTSRAQSIGPQPVQPRVLPRRPARKGKSVEPAAMAVARGNKGSGKGTQTAQAVIDDVGVKTNTRVPGKGKVVNMQAVGTASGYDGPGGYNDGSNPANSRNDLVRNDADHGL